MTNSLLNNSVLTKSLLNNPSSHRNTQELSMLAYFSDSYPKPPPASPLEELETSTTHPTSTPTGASQPHSSGTIFVWYIVVLLVMYYLFVLDGSSSKYKKSREKKEKSSGAGDTTFLNILDDDDAEIQTEQNSIRQIELKIKELQSENRKIELSTLDNDNTDTQEDIQIKLERNQLKISDLSLQLSKRHKRLEAKKKARDEKEQSKQ